MGRAFFDGYVQPVFANFASVFASAIENGLIRKTSPEQAAEHFSELCLGWMLRSVIWGLKPPPTDAEVNAYVKVGVTAFLDGSARSSWDVSEIDR